MLSLALAPTAVYLKADGLALLTCFLAVPCLALPCLPCLSAVGISSLLFFIDTQHGYRCHRSIDHIIIIIIITNLQLLEHIHGTAEVAVGASHDVLTVRSYHHPVSEDTKPTPKPKPKPKPIPKPKPKPKLKTKTKTTP